MKRMVCVQCRKQFLAKTSRGKYCSAVCRNQYHTDQRTAEQKAKKNEFQKKWNQENWLKRRAYRLHYDFGITLDQYNELLAKQDHRCFICQKHETEFAKKLAVDHDHKTMEVIGLLCRSCNQDLIGKRRDPNLFLRAAKYLQECRTGWYVPIRVKRRRRRKRG